MCEIEPIKKNHQNQHQGYKYRSIDDFYSSLNPLLSKHHVVLLPEVLSTSESTHTDSKGRLVYHVIATVKYTFAHITGGTLSATVVGEGVDTGDKASNKAMTAAFKNCMQQVFIIPTGDPADSERDNVEVTAAPPQRVQQKKSEWEANTTGRITL